MKKMIFILFAFMILTSFSPKKETREWYELKIYTVEKKDQSDRVDAYLKNAYIPAMHRLGYSSIGVFKPVETDSAFGKKIYVLIAYPSLSKFSEVLSDLDKDLEFQQKGQEYLTAKHDNVPFKRVESILMKSFIKHPSMKRPALTGTRSDRVYELRSYEGPTEKRNENKIKMFNDGDEVGLFARLNFNAVFYAEVFAGSRMPNLMYMTTFDNMQSRDEHWKAFVADAQWKKLVAMPEYQNNVSKADIFLLRPTEYSDY
jgi:NIPSNAP